MKIDNGIVCTPERQLTRLPKAPSAKPGPCFDQALAQELEGPAAPAAGLPEATPVEKVLGYGDGGLPPVWFQISGVVDSLDRYGEALGNPAYTLKDIEPLAAEMERQAETLQASLQKGGLGSLRTLAEQALVHVQVESIKFRRGDYV